MPEEEQLGTLVSSPVSSWVLYEKPNFKGDKIALDEGDIEIRCPFGCPEHQQNGHEERAEDEPDAPTKPEAGRKFIIGSIRRAVRVSRPGFGVSRRWRCVGSSI